MRRIWIGLVRLFGWKMVIPTEGARSEVRRSVIVAAPHTSVADFLIGIAYMWTMGVEGHIFIKKEFFRWPIGRVLRRMGCESVDRGNRRNGLVEQAVQGFASHADYTVILTPEATRKPVRRWKRGCWMIATRAGVPIVPVCIDYSKREIGLLPTLWPTDDCEADMQRLRALYRSEMARYPDHYLEQK